MEQKSSLENLKAIYDGADIPNDLGIFFQEMAMRYFKSLEEMYNKISTQKIDKNKQGLNGGKLNLNFSFENPFFEKETDTAEEIIQQVFNIPYQTLRRLTNENFVEANDGQAKKILNIAISKQYLSKERLKRVCDNFEKFQKKRSRTYTR